MDGSKATSAILVHGAWADGSCWAQVITDLHAKGIDTVAVQLPLSSLAEDVAVVKRAMALQDGPLVLVGHSYGGVVITEAGDDPKVAALVYVAAFAPDIGQSAFSLGALVSAAPAGSELRPDGENFLKLTRKGVLEDFAQDLPMAQREIMVCTQGPTAVAALSAPVSKTAWKGRPCWYVLSQDDRTIPPELQELMAAHLGAETVRVSASHVAMLGRPETVAQVIVHASEKAADRNALSTDVTQPSNP